MSRNDIPTVSELLAQTDNDDASGSGEYLSYVRVDAVSEKASKRFSSKYNEQTITIQKGDTLWSIAGEKYGKDLPDEDRMRAIRAILQSNPWGEAHQETINGKRQLISTEPDVGQKCVLPSHDDIEVRARLFYEYVESKGDRFTPEHLKATKDLTPLSKLQKLQKMHATQNAHEHADTQKKINKIIQTGTKETENVINKIVTAPIKAEEKITDAIDQGAKSFSDKVTKFIASTGTSHVPSDKTSSPSSTPLSNPDGSITAGNMSKGTESPKPLEGMAGVGTISTGGDNVPKPTHTPSPSKTLDDNNTPPKGTKFSFSGIGEFVTDAAAITFGAVVASRVPWLRSPVKAVLGSIGLTAIAKPLLNESLNVACGKSVSSISKEDLQRDCIRGGALAVSVPLLSSIGGALSLGLDELGLAKCEGTNVMNFRPKISGQGLTLERLKSGTFSSLVKYGAPNMLLGGVSSLIEHKDASSTALNMLVSGGIGTGLGAAGDFVADYSPKGFTAPAPTETPSAPRVREVPLNQPAPAPVVPPPVVDIPAPPPVVDTPASPPRVYRSARLEPPQSTTPTPAPPPVVDTAAPPTRAYRSARLEPPQSTAPAAGATLPATEPGMGYRSARLEPPQSSAPAAGATPPSIDTGMAYKSARFDLPQSTVASAGAIPPATEPGMGYRSARLEPPQSTAPAVGATPPSIDTGMAYKSARFDLSSSAEAASVHTAVTPVVGDPAAPPVAAAGTNFRDFLGQQSFPGDVNAPSSEPSSIGDAPIGETPATGNTQMEGTTSPTKLPSSEEDDPQLGWL